MNRILRHITSFFLVLWLAAAAAGQTFEIGGAQPSPNAPAGRKKAAAGASKKQAAAAPEGGMSWGSGIEVGRLARAADQALKKGNPGAAADYAQRALKAAPNDSRLWFLLGYTSRLAGRFPTSIDAYQHGLQRAPSSIEGLSGLAQTYIRVGKTDDAKRLLLNVINANPKRPAELMMAGELFIQTGDIPRGLGLLQRAEAIKPASHSELLMAVAYLKLKQPARAKQLLDKARARDPKNVDIFRVVATYYRDQHDYKSAIATLKSAPRMTPDVLGDLGYSYQLAGMKRESAEAYAKGAQIAPANINLQLAAAQAQVRANDLDKARAYLLRAEKLDPNHYRLHFLRADIARSDRRTADAIQEYTLALKNLPSQGAPEGVLFPIQLRLLLAEQEKEAGDDAAASQQVALAGAGLARVKVEAASQPEYLRLRASVKAASGDFSGAEADLKQALALDPENINIGLQYGSLLWKLKRGEESRKIFAGILQRDPANRYALEDLGYQAREEGDNRAAEQYFNRLAAAYPADYVPYMALGDLYTATRDFARAESSYEKAYRIAPSRSLIIAAGANAAIEARKVRLAGDWLARATPAMQGDVRILRERERYLFHSGKYLESARLGYQVIRKLPRDRDVAVYLAYDLYNLGRYDDVLAVTTAYANTMPKEANFPLLSGHVHKQSQLLDQAVQDYTRAMERDPKMVEAYVNRGYVLNDMQNAQEALQDFDTALKLAPKNGVAHLGMAFSNLQLHHGKVALQEAETAEKLLGESGSTHLAKAGAYRQLYSLTRAEKEYLAALKYAPDDLRLHLALADTQYHQRHYTASIQTLENSLRLSPDEPALIYARMAHAYAQLHKRDETFRYVKAAEAEDNESSEILLDTGDALITLGDREAAMDRFARALNAPDADRVAARLAIARLFVREGKWDDGRQQVSLAFAESRVGEASPVTADNLIEAANIFLTIQDFDLAVRYFNKAGEAGAGDETVAIGLANSFLAQGNDLQAEAQLQRLGNAGDFNENFDYTLARGNVYRQRHDNVRALGAFARANQLSGENDEIAERALLEVAGDEGIQLTNNVSLRSNAQVNGIFDDPTIYEIDARLRGITDPSLLPRPRSSVETTVTNAFRIHKEGIPTINSFFQVRNARGTISLPFENLILPRNTREYNFNNGISPTFSIGQNRINIDAGVQFTIRRDGASVESARDVNQNLFRQYLYLTTSSFGNWLAIRGSAIHDAGPFTQRDLSSRDLGARLEFIVGRPWGKTALVTGYTVRDLLFHPLVREFFTTSTYAGLQHKFFSNKLQVTGLGEYIRSWRVDELNFGAAQAVRPAVQFEYRANNRWSAEGAFAYARGEGFHAYDNVQSRFLISYQKPIHRTVNDGAGEVSAEYPLRFSLGIEQQTFPNFTGRGQARTVPFVRLTLF